MISGTLIHPGIISALASAGHGSTVLITDGHYAAKTAVGPNADRVFLNLTAGFPTVPQVVSVLLDTVTVEKATFISPNPDALPSHVQEEICALLSPSIPLESVARHEFYALARTPDLALCIVTGDTRRFANVLLTLGVLDRRLVSKG